MYKIIFILAVALSVYGCSEDAKKEKKENKSSSVATDLSMQNEAISFISSQNNPTMYGSIKVNQLLNKAYYNSEVGKSSLLESAFVKEMINEVERIKSYINTAIPIYYSFNIKNTSPSLQFELVAFGGINDRAAILKEMQKANSDLQSTKHGNFELIVQEGVGMAMTKDKFVFSAGFNSDGNPSTDGNIVSKFKKYFKSFNGKPDARVQKVFEKSKDVTMAFDYSNFYEGLADFINSQTDNSIREMYETQWKYLAKLDMAGSVNLAFEDGSISLYMNWYGSDDMEKTMKKLYGSPSKGIISKLGKGKPIAGLLTSIDVAEWQKYLDEMFPEGYINSLMEMNLGAEFESQIPPQLSSLEATLRKDGFDSFIGGDLGMMLYNVPNNPGPNYLPEMSVYFNIGENLKKLIDENELPNTEDKNIKIDVQNDRVNIYTKNHYPNGKGPEISGKLSHIGNTGLSAFIDLDQIMNFNNDWLKLEDAPKEAISILQMLDFIDAEVEWNGGHITLHMKDKSKNALTQVVDMVMEIAMDSVAEALFQ